MRTSVTVTSRFTRSLIRFTRLRCSLVLLVVLFVVVLLSTVMFSGWNVCRPDYDDDVDLQTAAVVANSSTRRPRRSAKTCLSPLTDVGLRVDVRLESYDDLQR